MCMIHGAYADASMETPTNIEDAKFTFQSGTIQRHCIEHRMSILLVYSTDEQSYLCSYSRNFWLVYRNIQDPTRAFVLLGGAQHAP